LKTEAIPNRFIQGESKVNLQPCRTIYSFDPADVATQRDQQYKDGHQPPRNQSERRSSQESLFNVLNITENEITKILPTIIEAGDVNANFPSGPSRNNLMSV